MSGGACFGCGPGYEGLAAELGGLVNGSWVLTPGIHAVMIMANGATLPRELPGQPSQDSTPLRPRSTPPRAIDA